LFSSFSWPDPIRGRADNDDVSRVLNHQEKRKKKKTRQGSSSNHFQLVPVDEFRPSSMFFFFFFLFSLCRESRTREKCKRIDRCCCCCWDLWSSCPNRCGASLSATPPLKQVLTNNECFSRYGQSSIIKLNSRCAIRTVGFLPCHRDPSGQNSFPDSAATKTATQKNKNKIK
jgi:hypothetical protein